LIIALALTACSSKSESQPKKTEAAKEAVKDAVKDAAEAQKDPDPFAQLRFDMVQRTIVDRGIKDERVIAAMKITPRHEFVPPTLRDNAYDDRPLPIGFDLTISQPYIVAEMTEAIHVKAGDKVLEIGTGSGYQAAVLAMMGAKVYTMEIHPELGARTQKVLAKLGFKDVQMRVGDGYFGWQDAAPFDEIMITCATPEIPHPLFMQLKTGGRIIAPVGDDYEQELRILTKTADGITQASLGGVRFGQMKGEIDKHR
jgi:protein-L-isoaspartate(D-aspartate) O-methyltransferase